MKLSELGEDAAISRMTSRLSPYPLPPGWIGIGCDAAVTDLPPGRILTTTDMLVEGIHFRRSTTNPRALGYKSLAVNVSDIFGMGGIPRWAVVALALPGDLDAEWIDEFYDGLLEATRRYDTPIVGGDAVGTRDGITISVAVTGNCKIPRLRTTARPGDILAATGPFGLSRAGLWALENPTADIASTSRMTAEHFHQWPTPRAPSGLEDIQRLSLMDDSDGLARSAWVISQASRVAITIEAHRLRIATEVADIAAVAGVDPFDWVIDGGEDYGLIGTFPKRKIPPSFRAIGRVDEGSGAWLEIDGKRTNLEGAAFRHF